MIFPVWQTLGQSSHLLAEECGSALGHKATHTGTLDPMAEGVVVVLTDDDRFAKGSLTDWQKVYEFSILWGVQTDSGDRLGVVQKISEQALDVDLVTQALHTFPLSYEQHLPAFSARRFEGKSGFDWAKESHDLPPRTRRVKLENITFLSSETVLSAELLKQHHDAVNTVHGDFRQRQVLESWQHTLLKTQKLLVTYHSVKTSPGTYVRQLVQDIASQLNVPATTWSITRTHNGPYEKQDCIEPEELSQL